MPVSGALERMAGGGGSEPGRDGPDQGHGPGGGPNFGIPAGTYGQKRDASGAVIVDKVFSSLNQTVTAKPALPAKLTTGEIISVNGRKGVGHALPRARRRRDPEGRDHHGRRHPAARHRRHAAAAARRRGARHRRRPDRPRARLVGRRARRPAAARPHGPHRGRDRRRRPLAPRRVDRPADRGRPPGHLAQRDARPPRAGLRRARGQRGPPAALHRRRLARAAHAAGLDPRLRGAVPHGRRAPSRPTSRRRWGASRTRPRAWACWSRTC